MSYTCSRETLNEHRKNPIDFYKFRMTDLEDLTLFGETSISNKDILHKAYIYYLCIVGNVEFLRNYLNFATIELELMGLSLDSILNQKGYEIFEHVEFHEKTPLDFAVEFNNNSELTKLLLDKGAINYNKNTNTKKNNSGILYCTDDHSDDAYILFKPLNTSYNCRFNCPFKF